MHTNPSLPVTFVALTIVGMIGLLTGCSTEQAEETQKTGQDTSTKEASTMSESMTEETEISTGPLQFTMNDISGNEVPLKKYKGQVVLMVNTASKCGLTPQYAGLQKLHEKYAGQGLAILGFPANQFNNQEPGTNEQIAQFCEKNYGVEFDMFSKIVVKGDDIHPLYAYLIRQDTGPQESGDINWNFEKFLIGRDGQVVARFSPRTKPDDPKLIAAIEKELGQE